MPGARAVLIALAAGLAVGLYFGVWFGWPTFLAVAIGATMAVVMLLFAASLSANPVEADAAWRTAAPDLAERERGSAATPTEFEADPRRAPEAGVDGAARQGDA